MKPEDVHLSHETIDILFKELSEVVNKKKIFETEVTYQNSNIKAVQ